MSYQTIGEHLRPMMTATGTTFPSEPRIRAHGMPHLRQAEG